MLNPVPRHLPRGSPALHRPARMVLKRYQARAYADDGAARTTLTSRTPGPAAGVITSSTTCEKLDIRSPLTLFGSLFTRYSSLCFCKGSSPRVSNLNFHPSGADFFPPPLAPHPCSHHQFPHGALNPKPCSNLAHAAFPRPCSTLECVCSLRSSHHPILYSPQYPWDQESCG